MDQLGDIDQLENLLRRPRQPGRAGRGRHRPGPRAPRRRRRPLARAAGRAGQDARGGRPHRAARGPLRAHAQGHAQDRRERARRPVRQAGQGPHRQATRSTGPASATSAPTRPSPTSSATRSTSTSSAPCATPCSRTGGGTPVRLSPDDFEVERTETLTRSSTVLMLDLSLSMPMRDNFLAAKKVAMALHSLISHAVPARLPRHRRVQRGRPRAQARAAARGVVGLRLRHQHAARLPAQPAHAGPPDRHQADHHDHRRRAHRPPRARRRRAVLQLPAGAGDRRRHAHRGRTAAPARASASTRSCSTPPATSRRSSRSSPR